MSDLTKKWKQYLNTRDPEIFNTIYVQSSIFVFMIAYRNKKDKIQAISITEQVYQSLKASPKDTDDFETMLNYITNELCK